MLSDRIKQIKPSATLKITAQAKKMKKEGLDVISFGAGEPDFDTPDFIKNEAIKSLKNGETKYTPASGMDSLKKAVVNKFKRDNQLDYTKENIAISCGAKHSIYNVIQVLINPEDEVIIFSPYWVSYIEQIRLANGVPVIVDTVKTDFKINFKELEEKITSKTKLIIVNSPQNPSGVVYSEEELKKLSEIIIPYNNIYIITDEIYEKLLYDNKKHSGIANTNPELKNRIIIINGVSKSYAMTGWRIGYLAAQAAITKAIGTLQSHSTSNPTSFCQTASITALNSDSDEVKKMIENFQKRRDLIFQLLSDIKELKVIKPEGAFYIFPEITNLLNKKHNNKKITDSTTFADALLEEKKIAVVPGVAFGCDNFVRLSFAVSEDNIKKGLKKIKEFIEELN